MERIKPINQVEIFFKEISEICDKISREEVEKFVDVLMDGWRKNRKIFTIGNGGSASTAVHFAADLNNVGVKIPGVRPVRAISLNENHSRLSALTNDEGWNRVYTSQLNNLFEQGDIVIAVSVHGGSGQDRSGLWSQNLLAALHYAKENGGKALGFTGFDGGAMATLCNANINVPFNSTPHVEGMHVVLHHLIKEELERRISEEYGQR